MFYLEVDMTRIEGAVYCDRCGVEITWSPYWPKASSASQQTAQAGMVHMTRTTLPKQEYCCRDCAEGQPCQCAERMEIDVNEVRYKPPIEIS